MLVGTHVTLRLFTEDDLDDFLSLENDQAEVGEFAPLGMRSPAAFRKEFRETGGWGDDLGRMLIVNRENRLLGHVVFFKEPSYQSGHEIGFSIFRRADRGKGYATQALRVFSAYLFALKPIPRLQLGTHVDNAGARRVAEKCGYQLEGTLREFYFARGVYADCVRYSLLRREAASWKDALQM